MSVGEFGCARKWKELLKEEGLHLDLAVSAQAGGDADRESAIVVAGMADEARRNTIGGHGERGFRRGWRR